ncbi:MAG: hypothetical protein JWM80_2947 [Cyanobacteria bacterium RYN_339]|nr:hypothetical protein [Cyanobacteria bacterium RYN_339]
MSCLLLALAASGCGHPLAALDTAPVAGLAAPQLALGVRALGTASIALKPTGLLAPGFWAPGALTSFWERLATATEDLTASGQWHAAYADLAPYHATLVDAPREQYDPLGFLPDLGLPVAPRATGRDDVALFKAWKLTTYKPNPLYFPGPDGAKQKIQAALLAGVKLSPGAIKGLDHVLERTLIRSMEKVDTLDPNPYGRVEDIVPGPQLAIAPPARYAGVAVRRRRQFAWDSGFHYGGPQPTDGRPEEKFGTYEIAQALGFSATQAARIAGEDLGVDAQTTHYLGPDGKPRKTSSGTGGANGDLHWHYNRAAAGKEDTRIAGARVHLGRAETFARAGRFDSAERELGIGLHGLQDMTAHAQITPLCHVLLGEFPDIQANNPVGVFEAALITEGYLAKYLDAVVPAAARPAPGAGEQVQGDATGPDKQRLRGAIATFPAALRASLTQGGVSFFLAAPGTTPLAAGFGTDLDGDGVISPGKWVDRDQDGKQGAGEVESQLPDGRDWAGLPAAYDADARRVYLSATLLDALDAPLQHELAHVLDDLWSTDPRWQAARSHQFRLARRAGAVTFADEDVAEYVARLLTTP